MSAHTRLSASSASRWMACPGSVRLSDVMPDDTSFAAAEGTFAHHIAACCLGSAGKGASPAQWLGNVTVIDGHTVECDQEMVDGVQFYLGEVTEDTQPGDKVWTEMSLLLALQKLDPDFGGTADRVRWRPSTRNLRVTDLKYGAGVFVGAEENPQLMMYALGALLEANMPAATVTVTIVQPRIEHPDGRTRDWTFNAADILNFASDAVAAAKATRAADAPLVPGKSQCQWCPARRTCPALEQARTDVAVAEFHALATYDPAKLGETLAKIALAKANISAIEAFAYAEATKGVAIPGWKLVAKQGRRQWTDEAGVVAWAKGLGVDPYEEPKVRSPAQMEDAAKKVRVKPAQRGEIGAFCESKSSGTALVADSDERPAVVPVSAADFVALPAPTAVNLF